MVSISPPPMTLEHPNPSFESCSIYAGSVCVYISSPNDFSRILAHLEKYGKVSNAKVNLAKTEAILN
jgi:hypothetical protein